MNGVFSVVIPAFNEEKLLAITLEAIHHAAKKVWLPAGWNYECIVCNNASTDQTSSIAMQYGASVIDEQEQQIGRARNTGASMAKGDWIVFIDADSVVSEGLFQDVLSQIQTNQVIMMGSTIRFAQFHWIGSSVLKLWNTVSVIFKMVAGSFIVCRREDFQELGGFDTSYFAGEELELVRRFKVLAKQRNQRIVILKRFPLLTSDRKMHLYQGKDAIRFFRKALAHPIKTMQNRDHCHAWYDGKR